MTGLYAAALAATLLGAGQERPGPEGGRGKTEERRPRDEAFKMIDAYLWNGEVTVLTNFVSVGEAERFLAEKCDTEEVLKDALKSVA